MAAIKISKWAYILSPISNDYKLYQNYIHAYYLMIAIWLKKLAQTTHSDEKDKMMFLISSCLAYI